MDSANHVPQDHYGILSQGQATSTAEVAAEQVRDLGYAVIDAGYSDSEMQAISAAFDETRFTYIEMYGRNALESLDELNTVRALVTHGSSLFLNLALNANLLDVLDLLILGKYILNQQNGIVNPPRQNYNQGMWHRDLPYQHFTSSRPLAINALFCVDDFTKENGATFVLPASHKSEKFPSDEYRNINSIQITAKSGSFILLDCMTFHSGGRNTTEFERRAINHVYNIPFFKQQINIPANMSDAQLSEKAKDILGFGYIESLSIKNYLDRRVR